MISRIFPLSSRDASTRSTEPSPSHDMTTQPAASRQLRTVPLDTQTRPSLSTARSLRRPTSRPSFPSVHSHRLIPPPSALSSPTSQPSIMSTPKSASSRLGGGLRRVSGAFGLSRSTSKSSTKSTHTSPDNPTSRPTHTDKEHYSSPSRAQGAKTKAASSASSSSPYVSLSVSNGGPSSRHPALPAAEPQDSSPSPSSSLLDPTPAPFHHADSIEPSASAHSSTSVRFCLI